MASSSKVESYNKLPHGFRSYNGNLKNAHYLEHLPDIKQDIMEENELYKFLSDAGLNRRTDILEKLLLDVRRSSGKLLYNDTVTIFQGLAIALFDRNGDVRLKCIQLISETIGNLGDDLDPCMYEVLPNLIPNLGDTKITIRRSVVQALHLYMKYTGDFTNLLQSFRGSSAASNLSQLSDVPKKKVLKTGEEEIKVLNSLLSANDWRDRHKGVQQFLDMSENDSDIIASHIAKIFDKFLPRLHDPNVKVNLFALKVMTQVIPVLSASLSSVISLTIQKITPNLNSKNKEIYSITMDALDAIMDHVEETILIQPFADQAMCASPRGKPDLVEKVAYLVTKVYPKKQKHVVLHVLPLLWDLLGSSNTGSSNIQSGHTALRSATIALATTLHQQMRSSLFDHAKASPTVSQRQLNLLQELIDQ